ncbi:MAG TPA: polysaccharide deacetylase family protein [Mobilitalea sp.]|nr:polysaccharide deacetylase family protein [Mobilitalea sp.]
MAIQQNPKEPIKAKKSKMKLFWIVILELVILLVLVGIYFVFIKDKKEPVPSDKTDISEEEDPLKEDEKVEPEDLLTPEELKALEEQERIQAEFTEMEGLIAEADHLTLGYDYDGAIELIKSYQGNQGGYTIYPVLVDAITRIEADKASLLLYGGSYTSVTQFNHVFFHSLVADNSKAFDGDDDSTGYNMYMTTVTEFENMMQSMYDDGYVLVSIHDIANIGTLEDGTTRFVEKEIYLPEGKKPFVLSQDDVNYYDYMTGDGFASRIVIGEDGKPTCEMVLDDGSIATGDFDMVPIVDRFVEEHPDFSYNGAKGIIALTGYEGTLGYRTNDPESPTYEQDKEKAKAVAEVMKAGGWEFASHTWGHKNMQTRTFSQVKTDMNRWLEEVSPLIGPTDILLFPFGVDIETTMGTYSNDKFQYLKEVGFNYYCGVDKKPWMHVKKEYVRMTRRPLDGQAMLEFTGRLDDLFDVQAMLDPERPARDW